MQRAGQHDSDRPERKRRRLDNNTSSSTQPPSPSAASNAPRLASAALAHAAPPRNSDYSSPTLSSHSSSTPSLAESPSMRRAGEGSQQQQQHVAPPAFAHGQRSSLYSASSHGRPFLSHRQSSDNGSGISVNVHRGDSLSLDGYRDIKVVSVHYDDVVACRAFSIARGDLKVFLKVSLTARPTAAAQFKAEAVLIGQLREAGVHNITHVIAREMGKLGPMLIVHDNDVRTLAEVYATPERRLAPHWTENAQLVRALDLSTKLVRAISRIHALGIVHGSLRPTTISVSIFSEIHLHDFSCAFRLGSESPSEPIRERGMREESLPYLAPECTGRVGKSVDSRSDYYSIGATLYELFTGQPPFADAVDPLEIIHAHIARRAPLMHTLDPSIPEPLSFIIAKLLEKSAQARYQTSQGLLVDLEQVFELVREPRSPPADDAAVSSGGLPSKENRGFQVGAIDSAAHFQLPPATRLFGRDKAIDDLAQSYSLVRSTDQTGVVVIKGHSGIGKTSLVETVRKPAALANGYFTSVKFDQIKSPVPFYAITGALSGLLRRILSESEAELAKWRLRLSEVFGQEGRVLADAVPLFESVFEPGWLDSLPKLAVLPTASETEARFQRVVQQVLRIFASHRRPLIIIFDDLQWCAPSDIAFILSLSRLSGGTTDSRVSHPILLICLYRDNEVNLEHPISTMLLPNLAPSTLTIQLEPLTLTDVMSFVSETLRTPVSPSLEASHPIELPREDASLRKLSELVLSKTLGSPLFVAQLLKAMNQEGLFVFDFEANRWQYDLDDIASKSLSTDVVQLLTNQMRKFPLLTQQALSVVACLGNEEVSAEIVAAATGRALSEVAYDLQEAIGEGLIVPKGEILPKEVITVEQETRITLGDRIGAPIPAFFRFFHDRCQQAAYSLVPSADRAALHYLIGQRLATATSDETRHDMIFDIANQLNHGIEILSSLDERDQLAHFNYLAAVKANKTTAFEPARKFLQIASDLLGPAGWVGQYELMANVTEALIDVEYSLTDYAASQEYIKIYLAHSRDVIAKLRVSSRSIRCASATGESMQAIAIGRDGLAMIDIHLPLDTEEAARFVASVTDELSITSEKVVALAARLEMRDQTALGAQAILAALVPPIYFVRIDLLGAITSLSLRNATEHGLDAAGAFMLTLHAVIVHGAGDPQTSLALGRAAIAFIEKNGSTPLSCPTYKVYASHVAVWHMPIRETIPFFRQAVGYGIEYRDAFYVGFGCGELCVYSLLAGINLPDMAAELDRFSVVVRKFRNELSTLYIGVIRQIALNFTGRASVLCELDGEAFSSPDYQLIVDKSYGIIIFTYHLGRLMLSLFFNEPKLALESCRIGREWMHGSQGLIYSVYFRLFEAVVLYDAYDTLSAQQLEYITGTQDYFSALESTQPANFRTPKLWLQAEEARARGATTEALAYYDKAIVAAVQAEYTHFAACMNERAALLLDNRKMAVGYILEAKGQWTAWGCLPKVAALELAFPHLWPSTPSPFIVPSPRHLTRVVVHHDRLSSIDDDSSHDHTETDKLSSQRGEQLINGKGEAWGTVTPAGIKRSKASSESEHSMAGRSEDGRSITEHRGSIAAYSDSHSRSHLATELDLRTVVSASSVISSEILVDGVVSKLLSLALRTAGAELCLLVLDKSGTMCAEALARADGSEVQHFRRTDAIDAQPDRYPCSVINYVARTRAMVVNNLDAAGEVISDPYLKSRKSKSILCLALVSQLRVVGVLYMENSQTENAFTPDRLEILSLISSQAASTIEKARLVQDLKSANADLKRSQATLENYNRDLEASVIDRTLELRHKNDLLVAEIAEKERAQAIAESATQMKSQFLANMSHEIRTPFNAVVALAGLLLDTQLNPLQADYVETIKNSSQELLVVINDVLDLSKLDKDAMSLSKDKVQIRSVLESSLDMLAERAASKGVELALVIDEGDIAVIADVTRLRQIVVNLLSNAVKFTSNGEIIVTASSQLLPEEGDQPPQVRVRISVQDTGIGIAPENFNKLFRVYSQVDGSQTTKLFGGTGLGLAISRKLSLLMGGDISVESELGHGATFTLEFLAPHINSPEVDVYAVTQNPDFVGKRCLVVDPNVTSRNVLRQLISSFGLTVDAPEDIADAYGVALAAHASNKPHDVVVVDAFLPGFAAQILLRRLRQKNVDAPAIALTRMGSPIYEELTKLDCKFLIKPIKRNRLHHTLRTIFPSHEAVRTSPATTPNEVFPTNLAVRNPLTILCAEDNPINVKVITHLLKRIGYSCEIAEDGQVAYEKAVKKRYDLIFMDVNMPRMNGLEATKLICEAIPRETRPLIVAMTALAMSSDRDMCLAAGCDGYVSKPILVPDLVAALTDAGVKAQQGRTARGEDVIPAPPLAPVHSASFELELPARRLSQKRDRASSKATSTSLSGITSGSSTPLTRSPEPAIPPAL